MKNTNTIQRRSQITEPIPVADFTIKYLTCDNRKITTFEADYSNAELGFTKGDLLVFDENIEPEIGNFVVYTRGKKSFAYIYDGKKPEGYKNYRLLGVLTHILKCVYKHSDDILNAEFLTEGDLF